MGLEVGLTLRHAARQLGLPGWKQHDTHSGNTSLRAWGDMTGQAVFVLPCSMLTWLRYRCDFLFSQGLFFTQRSGLCVGCSMFLPRENLLATNIAAWLLEAKPGVWNRERWDDFLRRRCWRKEQDCALWIPKNSLSLAPSLKIFWCPKPLWCSSLYMEKQGLLCQEEWIGGRSVRLSHETGVMTSAHGLLWEWTWIASDERTRPCVVLDSQQSTPWTPTCWPSYVSLHRIASNWEGQFLFLYPCDMQYVGRETFHEKCLWEFSSLLVNWGRSVVNCSWEGLWLSAF